MESVDVLNNLMKREGLNPNSLSKAMGITRSQPIYDILSGKVKHISRDYAEKIISAFPQYNKVWLILGEGAMLKTDTDETSPINVDGDLNSIEMEREIKRLRASLDLALEKNERLEAELAEYKAKEGLGKESA